MPNSDFLRLTAEILARLELESSSRGNRMLASLLDIAKSEAEDGLKARDYQQTAEETNLRSVLMEISTEMRLLGHKAGHRSVRRRP
jgi:hypothetical protein